MESTLSFTDGFLGREASRAKRAGSPSKSFDWDKATEIIKALVEHHPDLEASAGLDGDWVYTASTIFQNGKPILDHGCYTTSIWETPALQVCYDDVTQDIPCYVEEELSAHSTWSEDNLATFGYNHKRTRKMKIELTEADLNFIVYFDEVTLEHFLTHDNPAVVQACLYADEIVYEDEYGNRKVLKKNGLGLV